MVVDLSLLRRPPHPLLLVSSRSLIAGLLIFAPSCSTGSAQTSLSRAAFDRSFDCGAAATAIHRIQGSGSASALIGEIHTVEAIVVGDFQESDELNGFFLQEENAEADDDPLTSEGIFVFESGSAVAVAAGDVVRVTGTVAELPADQAETLTQLNAVTSVVVCSSANPLPQTTDLTLPFADTDHLERPSASWRATPTRVSIGRMPIAPPTTTRWSSAC